jgi:hypothetical protein
MSISIAVASTSAIPDYPTLKAVIADWLDRDDLNTRIPTFVQMAEAMFNRELRTPDMETSTLLSADQENVALPDNYLAMRAIYVEGSPDRPLRGIAPTAIREEYSGATGTPQAYTLVSRGLRLAPPPAAALQLQLDYYAKIDGLTDASPANWLLDKHPDLYLYGSLFYAEQMLDNAPRAAQWKELLDEVMARVNRAANNDRYGAGPLVPNTARQVGGRSIC